VATLAVRTGAATVVVVVALMAARYRGWGASIAAVPVAAEAAAAAQAASVAHAALAAKEVVSGKAEAEGG